MSSQAMSLQSSRTISRNNRTLSKQQAIGSRSRLKHVNEQRKRDYEFMETTSSSAIHADQLNKRMKVNVSGKGIKIPQIENANSEDDDEEVEMGENIFNHEEVKLLDSEM
jgi:hypothetical protein